MPQGWLAALGSLQTSSRGCLDCRMKVSDGAWCEKSREWHMGKILENHHAFSIGNMAIHLQIGGCSIASELHIVSIGRCSCLRPFFSLFFLKIVLECMVNISPESNIFIMLHMWAGCFVIRRMVLFHSPQGFCKHVWTFSQWTRFSEDKTSTPKMTSSPLIKGQWWHAFEGMKSTELPFAAWLEGRASSLLSS